MIRCAITDGSRYGTDVRFDRLMHDAARWANAAIDLVQLREKDMSAGELLRIASAMQATFREQNAKTKLLINGRADVAVAAKADGVHLTSAPEELIAEQVRQIFTQKVVVSISCHTQEDVARAHNAGVDLILFGPVFEKRVGGQVIVEGLGVEMLRKACVEAGDVPVLALGGLDSSRVDACIQAGAAGIAGIRLFS